MPTNHGSLLNGAIPYEQPVNGHRTGIEPILLAACIPAKPGESVLEAGAGAGAGSLCLAHRLPDVHVTALERDIALAELAQCNARYLTHDPRGQRVSIVAADIRHPPFAARFDHAMANPPWHDLQGTPSPVPRKETAKRAYPSLYLEWAKALCTCLRHKGTLTMILPAAHLEMALTALTLGGCGSLLTYPLWPRIGVDAKLLIVRGVRGGAGPCRIAPGLVLHDKGQAYTPQMQAILQGNGLTL